MKAPSRFTFHAADGAPLIGTLYEPEAGTARRSAVLIAGALGVAQRHCAPFAAWLAARGHTVMGFDLRGMGASRQARHRRSLRGVDADMLTCARSDFPAAVAQLVAVNDGHPLTLIGHSLGLHHAGMTEVCPRKLLAAFKHAPSRLFRVAPVEVGLTRIGHLGAFRVEGTERLWLRLAAAVDAMHESQSGICAKA